MRLAPVIFFSAMMAQTAIAQRVPFSLENHPAPPDYTLEGHWSALPFRTDVADVLPRGEAWVSDSAKAVDVFYVHPTTYQRGKWWNCPMDSRRQRRRVDKYPVRLQASAFNDVGRVYAPRYRQAVVSSFFDHRYGDGERALDLAYRDVRQAFLRFLEIRGADRPFILASHSQGTHHARRLLRELIDTTALRHQLVVAYVVGMTVNEAMYENLRLCQLPEETGCYLTWMTHKEGTMPKWDYHIGTESINPVSWLADTLTVPEERSKGSVVLNPSKVYAGRTSARVVNRGGQLVWVRTRVPLFRSMRDLHVADYGLFYLDIRENAALRSRIFLAKKSMD